MRHWLGAALCGAALLMSAPALAQNLALRAPQWAQALLFIVLITLFGGYLMKIYAWKTILGNEGVLNSALTALGLISSPITSLLYSPQAVVLTLMHFSLPFAVLPIYASMRGIADSEVEAARDLGAGPRARRAGCGNGRRAVADCCAQRSSPRRAHCRAAWRRACGRGPACR